MSSCIVQLPRLLVLASAAVLGASCVDAPVKAPPPTAAVADICRSGQSLEACFAELTAAARRASESCGEAGSCGTGPAGTPRLPISRELSAAQRMRLARVLAAVAQSQGVSGAEMAEAMRVSAGGAGK